MQYENGCWLLKEGFAAFSPAEVYEVLDRHNRLVLSAPTWPVSGKGATLEGIILTLEITAPRPGMLRVRTVHHRGRVKKGPAFALNLDPSAELDCDEEAARFTLRSGDLTLVIEKKPFSMTFLHGDRLLAKSGPRDLCYVKEDWHGHAYDRPGGCWMSQRLSLSVDELIYGLGERFGAYVKNGQTVVIENQDGGTSSQHSYKNIPFYLSSRGYGVLVNHPERVEFEVGTEQVSRCGFSVAGEELDYVFIDGPSMKDVLARYTDLTGKPGLPPQWSFGLWLSTSFTTEYNTEVVMSFVNGMLDRGIPLSVFHFDCCWMREFHWSDFLWDDRSFRDPAALLRALKEKGLRVCVWINPYIAQNSALFDEGMEKGYFLHRRDGSVWQWDMWQSGMAIVDFTNPAAASWYLSALKALLDMGVDAFKTDFGERIPTEDAVWFDGSDPEKMHNYYAYLYNDAVYRLLERERGRGEAVVFARAATVGCQQFPVHWGGDCWSDYDSMAQSLRGGLGLTSSGFGFWAHDIGGFEDTSTADVYKRWLAFGLLSTHSRLHGSSSYRVPWAYDEEAVAVCRFFTRLKLSLLPYLYSSACVTANTGVPMIRSMAISFEDDPNCRYLDKQYMLGDALLVAPIFNEEGMAAYYLPKGRWINYLTHETAEGGVWRRERHDYCSIPLWVKAGSVIPTARRAETADVSFVNNLEYQVFGLTDRAACTVYQDGRELTQFAVRRRDGLPEVVSGGESGSVVYIG